MTGLMIFTCSRVTNADQSGDWLFSTDGSTVSITGYVGSGGLVTVPGSINSLPVTSLADRAFYGNTAVKNVVIPDTVASIGTSAFTDCTGITNIGLGNGVRDIGVWCFQNCTNLPSINIPDTVTNIGAIAFGYCYRLTNINIGTGVSTLGVQPFYLCTNLTTITVDLLNGSFSTLNGALFDHDQTTLIVWPAGKSGNYTVPVTVTNIGNDAFQYCYKLTNVVFPDGLVRIGNGAFYNCTNLSSPAFPTNLAFIGDYAFQFSSKLTNIVLPASVINIGVATFGQCAALASFTVDPLNSSFSSVDGVLLDKSEKTLLQFPAAKLGSYVIPQTVTSIGNSAFSGARGLTRVSIPAGVTNIGNNAFYGCSTLSGVVLPRLTTIQSGTFSFCNNLQNIFIPASVTNIDLAAFSSCGNLKGVFFEGGPPTLGSSVFVGANVATVYFTPGTTGWGVTFGARPTLLWNPSADTADSTFGVQSNSFGFTIKGTMNIPVVVEVCTNLSSPAWIGLKSFNLTNGSVYISDAQWTNYSIRYFRFRSP
ncbi:leucine-rich repeat domain-containing protein [Pedosphaera parvula]|uniref:leucine-rich repeat domain-containing protein n=1 Tax=Pedosphaera parvula TaxID=1032527 RepID=UPI00135F1140|nr:leucine-rich repeat domain-containing protein [Pedosphaera parvula]